jgi:hypothetical protein
MTPEDIDENLRRFDRDIGEVLEVFNERPAGHESIVEEKYRALKEEIEEERAKGHRPRQTDDLTEQVLQFYDGAINDTWLELGTKAGARYSDGVIGELNNASAKLRYHLLQLSKHTFEEE